MLTPVLGGVILAVRLGTEMLALRVGEKLAIAPPPLCPQAATKHPARRIAAASSRLSVKRRIWIPPHCSASKDIAIIFPGTELWIFTLRG
jgi:hypothetical protein